MKSRRQNASEDRLITSRRYSPSEISVHSESIPIDLIIEILSRLPAKSIAKCRCLSKFWASILRRPDFTELFLTRSRARPKLLFASHKMCTKLENGQLIFYSSPQNPDENSSPITASYLMKIPCNYEYDRVWHINGLVFFKDERILKGRKNRAKVSIICKPNTGQSSVLSKMKTRCRDLIYSYLGYDPIEKQFKVLSMTTSTYTCQEFQVMTLGTRKVFWRKVECGIPHHPECNVICVNGVLYYRARSSVDKMIVCFDIRSEKFHFMNVGVKIIGYFPHINATLINYNGKLGSLITGGYRVSSSVTTWFVLWILEDTEKQEWSKHVHVLPPMWKNIAEDISLDFVGVIGENEFVFSPLGYATSFFLIYYNSERNTVRRVEIQGLEATRPNRIYTFLNHVEDINLIDGC